MMASLTLRNLDEEVKARLRVRAAEHGRSMEDEARHIIREALDREPPRTLADLALELFGPEHGVELEQHPPVNAPEPPRFDP
jgi:plasmid stability protein